MTYYDILEVRNTASNEVIKAAYRTLAQKYHPDKNSSIDTQEKMREINVAYDVLSDEEKRKKYDNDLKGHSTQTEREEDLEILRIEIPDILTGVISVLEISKAGLSYKENTILKNEIQFIAIRAVEQKTSIRNFGANFLIKIGNKDKSIEISFNNKNNNGFDELFDNVSSTISGLFAELILTKIVEKIENFGGYNVNDLFEFNAKGVFLIANKNKATKDNMFIPYKDLQIDFYKQKVIILNKVNLTRLELSSFQYINNAIYFDSLVKYAKSVSSVGTKESPEENIWKYELTSIQRQKEKWEQSKLAAEEANFNSPPRKNKIGQDEDEKLARKYETNNGSTKSSIPKNSYENDFLAKEYEKINKSKSQTKDLKKKKATNKDYLRILLICIPITLLSNKFNFYFPALLGHLIGISVIPLLFTYLTRKGGYILTWLILLCFFINYLNYDKGKSKIENKEVVFQNEDFTPNELAQIEELRKIGNKK